MDQEILGRLVAILMDSLDEFGEDCQIRTAAIVVEVATETSFETRSVCTDDRSWVEVAFLREAADVAECLHFESRTESQDEGEDS